MSQLIACLVLLGGPLGGGLPLAAQQAPAACTSPDHRAFDFWIGEWEVFDTTGTLAGVNVITSEENGCLLRERWRGSGGGTGQSMNFFRDGRWHQVWVAAGGSVLELSGTSGAGTMTLEGPGVLGSGERIESRITWTLLHDGSVRQVWAVSRDSGETWLPVFDGLYRRKQPADGQSHPR